MHKLQMYENLMDMLEREVKEIANKGNLDSQSLDILYKVMMSIKAADKHMETLEGASQESYGRGSYEGRSNNSGRSYDSYGRRSRDAEGRYSEDSFRYSEDRERNSYEYSRDGATEAMKQRLEAMMREPVSENVRLALMDCLNKIK